MNKNIVIIEDETEIIDSLKFLFEKNQFTVMAYGSAEEFFIDKGIPEHCVYLVDWNLPGIKGVDIIRTIRMKDKISPIFMISAYNRPEQIIEGLQSGADDYISKPFNFDELLMRVQNAYSKMHSIRDNLINVGIKLIPEASAVMRNGVTVNLTSREFIIFNYLYQNRPKPITREELIAQFEKDLEMTARNIDVHIFSVRKKTDKININIETVWGTGYRIVI
jgi:two-component system alkaline phosphatase synthesis response regulator PhoP